METNLTYHDNPDPCLVLEQVFIFYQHVPKKDLIKHTKFLILHVDAILDAPASSGPRIL